MDQKTCKDCGFYGTDTCPLGQAWVKVEHPDDSPMCKLMEGYLMILNVKDHMDLVRKSFQELNNKCDEVEARFYEMHDDITEIILH